MKRLLTIWATLVGAVVALALSSGSPLKASMLQAIVNGAGTTVASALPLDVSITGSYFLAYGTYRMSSSELTSQKCFDYIDMTSSATGSGTLATNDCNQSVISSALGVHLAEVTKIYDRTGGGHDCTPETGHRPQLLLNAVNGLMSFSKQTSTNGTADCLSTAFSSVAGGTIIEESKNDCITSNQYSTGVWISPGSSTPEMGLITTGCGGTSALQADYFDGTTHNKSGACNTPVGYANVIAQMVSNATKCAVNGTFGSVGSAAPTAQSFTQGGFGLSAGSAQTQDVNHAMIVYATNSGSSISDANAKSVCDAEATIYGTTAC